MLLGFWARYPVDENAQRLVELYARQQKAGLPLRLGHYVWPGDFEDDLGLPVPPVRKTHVERQDGEEPVAFMRRVKLMAREHAPDGVIGVLDANLAAARACATWDPRRNRKSLYLQGPVGAGKSLFAAATMNRLIALGPVRKVGWRQYAKAQGLDLELLGEYLEEETVKIRYPGVWPSRWVRGGNEGWHPGRDILVYDDIGAEAQPNRDEELWAPAQAVSRTLSFVNLAYDSGMRLIFTSNHSIDTLGQIYGSRVSSRLHEMCSVYELEGNWR